MKREHYYTITRSNFLSNLTAVVTASVLLLLFGASMEFVGGFAGGGASSSTGPARDAAKWDTRTENGGMEMNIMDLISSSVNQQVSAMCADAGQLTLGELDARLESFSPDLTVVFDTGRHPGTYDSYRGYYNMVAVDLSDSPITVSEFQERTRAAIGATFQGYKGGDYRMTRHTPVWVSEYGRSSGIGIVGVEAKGGRVVLKTAQLETW